MTTMGATDLDMNYNLVAVAKEDVKYVGRGINFSWIHLHDGTKIMVGAKCAIRVTDRHGHVSVIRAPEDLTKLDTRQEFNVGFAALLLLSLGLIARLLR
jgi:hypothetical protein